MLLILSRLVGEAGVVMSRIVWLLITYSADLRRLEGEGPSWYIEQRKPHWMTALHVWIAIG